MSEAAKKLNISQPTVSHAILEIENQYNVRLFKRVSKKLYITETGSKLYNYSLKILDLFDSIDSFLKNENISNVISIGVSLFADTFFLADTIKNFEYIHPEINIKVNFDTIENIVDKIQYGFYDIGIVCEDIYNDKIKSEKLFDDELVLVCSKKHRLAKKESVTLYDLENENFALRESNNNAKKTFFNVLSEKGIHVNLKWIYNNNDTVINIVQSNSAISVLSKYTVHSDNIATVPFEDISVQHSYNLIYNKDNKLSREINFLKNYIVTLAK